MKSKQTIINGLSGTVIGLYIRLDVLRMAWKWSQNLVGYLHVLQGLKRMVNQYLGENIRRRYVKVDGRYHWNLYIPGWKTLAYTKNIESEAFRFAPNGNKANRFTNVFLAITSRCPLRCEHCFEWDVLNGSDTLSLADLKSIVNRIQQVGSGQIQFSGGEPMLRIDDLIEILHSAMHDTEFWMLTSGYNLTLLNAQRLKQAGLDGVVVSLDHFDPEKHNQFRGNPHAFEWAEKAIVNSIEANLVTSISLCATNSFATEENLMRYMEMAKALGVSFVQILEPQAVGHYKGMPVSLETANIKIIEDFYFRMMQDKAYAKYPIICYHGHYQRKAGCFGAGNRSLYVDPYGGLNPCPFCRQKAGNALTEDIVAVANRFQKQGCLMHPSFK